MGYGSELTAALERIAVLEHQLASLRRRALPVVSISLY
jgi:hypothetical protein